MSDSAICPQSRSIASPAKTALLCEACPATFYVYTSVLTRAAAAGQRVRFCSAACLQSTRTGPKCTRCGAPNHRGRRTRICESCFSSSPALKQQRARERLAACPEGLRWCTRCDLYLDPAMFASKEHICTECQRFSNKRGHLKRKYGIDEDTYQRLLAAQGGGCAICGMSAKRQRLHVDHDHATGTIRGLLCLWCNHRLLGGARESVEILQSAISYLTAPPARSAIGLIAVPVLETPEPGRVPV